MRCTRENLERRHPGRRRCGTGTDGRIWNLRGKTHCKGSVNAGERWQFYIPSRRWNGKNSLEEIRFWEHPPWSGIAQTEEKNKVIFKENHDGDAGNDFWSISGNFIYSHHVEPRVKLYVPREQSFPVPLNLFDVTRTTDTSLDVMLEKTSWTGFTRFTFLDEKPPDGYTWSRERLTRKQTTSRPDTLWPEIWKDMSDASKRKSGLSRNQLSTMPEDCVVFISLILMMRNSRISWKMRVESGKFRCQPQCLTSFNVTTTGTPVAQLKNTRQNTLVLLKPDESMRKRMEGSPHKKSRRSHGCKRTKFTKSLQFDTQVYSDASSNENTRRKGSSG